MAALNEAANGLIATSKAAAGMGSSGLAAQRGAVESMRSLLQKLQAEKVSLSAIVKGTTEEFEENEKQLKELSQEVESLQVSFTIVHACELA